MDEIDLYKFLGKIETNKDIDVEIRNEAGHLLNCLHCEDHVHLDINKLAQDIVEEIEKENWKASKRASDYMDNYAKLLYKKVITILEKKGNNNK
jgi:hypothetical protein